VLNECNPAPIQAVLFDYGQVLSGPPSPAAWARMLQISGMSEEAFNQAYWAPRHDYDRGMYTGATYWQAAGRYAGAELTTQQVAELIQADNALWTEPNQPMIDWALRLQTAGMRTGILSNLGDAMSAGVIAAFPWLDGFHHRVWSYTLKLAKPDPAIYMHAAAGLGVTPAAILFVDDREDNIAGALAVGMQAIRYTTQPVFEQELAARGLAELWHMGRPHTR
jgi:putative hydrolase of the HAD superfamily